MEKKWTYLFSSSRWKLLGIHNGQGLGQVNNPVGWRAVDEVFLINKIDMTNSRIVIVGVFEEVSNVSHGVGQTRTLREPVWRCIN